MLPRKDDDGALGDRRVGRDGIATVPASSCLLPMPRSQLLVYGVEFGRRIPFRGDIIFTG